MAEIMNNEKFLDSWGRCFDKEKTDALLHMQPGEHKLIQQAGFNMVFVRVTKFHIARMNLAEFNGEK
ncbi:MAG: hypothetical protein IJE68_06380 [Clostridia bacterium]|nr:hypothetical protein [Clostridia bacterium]